MALTPETIRRLLSEREPRTLSAEDRLVAAVLVPMIWHGEEPHLLFTQRTETVRHHQGQISFPGGHRDPGDPDLIHTALREAHEELGLPPSDVEVLGRLSDYLTRTSIHHLTPIVGHVHRVPGRWVLQEDEVAEAFEVPLTDLLDPSIEGIYEWTWEGRRGTTPAFRWQGRLIWGATAEMLVDFLGLLRGRG
ncbi:CoA pyrophosphatase [Candidatus Sumerlaeota bacterium]|nr:CoA pyrophosphatase [Candidatus Sumerlaeota bacterium]